MHDLHVAGRSFVRSRQRRRTEPPAPGRDELERLQRALPDDAVAVSRIVEIPADRPPWQATGIELSAGDRVSTFAVGRVVLSRALDVWIGPHFQLWGRIGGVAPVFRGTRVTNTFVADRDGQLELASYFPGEWADPSGRQSTDPSAYRKASGGMCALVVRWATGADPATCLRALADPTGLVAGELDRLAGVRTPPEGWRYLWYLGDSETFSGDGAAGEQPSIVCRTESDVGILQYDVDVPLTDATQLRWSWRVDELPSALPEDTLPTHDYMSIALEFDNGQDLTWHWSAALPVEHAYRCPIPTWKDKETHIVVRSGSKQLGSWLSEERPVARDYAAAVGPPPERIVRVWLIAVSLFQRGTGRCAFASIELADGEDVLAIGL